LTFIAVFKATVVDTEPEPLRSTTLGETVQVEFAGAPLQVRFTFPVRPPIAVSVIWNIPWCPEGMVWAVGDAVMVKFPTDSVTVTAADVLAAKFELPPYAAVSVLEPAVVNVSEQLPTATEFEHDSPVLAVRVTVPVGVPAPGATANTANFTVTGCPSTEGFGEVDVIAVALLAIFTV
jgi:hypothetical protein